MQGSAAEREEVKKKQDFVLNTLNMFFPMFPGCDTALWVSQDLWEGCF